jgi:hypothetical protein
MIGFGGATRERNASPARPPTGIQQRSAYGAIREIADEERQPAAARF